MVGSNKRLQTFIDPCNTTPCNAQDHLYQGDLTGRNCESGGFHGLAEGESKMMKTLSSHHKEQPDHNLCSIGPFLLLSLETIQSSTLSHDRADDHGFGSTKAALESRVPKEDQSVPSFATQDLLIEILTEALQESLERKVMTCNEPQQESTDLRDLTRVDEGNDVEYWKDEKVLDSPHLVQAPNVRTQLRNYITRIASLYRNNAFHNFEHAYHVTTSVATVLNYSASLGREDNHATKVDRQSQNQVSELNFGCLTFDPLMQFALLFAALIHDVDHRGLTNQQLVKIRDPMVLSTRGAKCLAEQHSIRCAMELLLDDDYTDFRRCIYRTEEEQMRFHKLVLHAVIATDIADMGQQATRRKLWIEAFQLDLPEFRGNRATVRKVTGRLELVACECILQLSDVIHTMQSWEVYSGWNQRLFNERYSAFCNGTDEADPSIGWYEGELWFYDNYVLPLAKSLKECQCFGELMNELLENAVDNRTKWVHKGEEIVNRLTRAYHKRRQMAA